ncbi:hypothetical protein Q7P37_000020 [Cladosporium fusiforme]
MGGQAGPKGRGWEFFTVLITFFTLTTIAFSARVYTRKFIQKAFGLDDWCAVIAWACLLVFTGFALNNITYGTGQHHRDIVPQSDIPTALKYWWLCEPLFIIATMAIKAAIALMLLRLSVSKIHRAIVWINFAVTQLYSTIFFFIFLFQCYPSAYFWTRFTGGEGSCMNPNIVVFTFYGYSAVACVTDWVFAILPAFLVWELQMSRREKASVIVVLATGALASAATIARFPYLHGMSDEADFLYATIEVAIWSTIELNLGCTAACCATLRPLFRKIIPSFGMSSRGRSYGSSKPHGTPTLYKRTSGETSGELELGDVQHGKGFGTSTVAWHHDDAAAESDRDADAGSNHSQTMIINTKTSVYRSEEFVDIEKKFGPK